MFPSRSRFQPTFLLAKTEILFRYSGVRCVVTGSRSPGRSVTVAWCRTAPTRAVTPRPAASPRAPPAAPACAVTSPAAPPPRPADSAGRPVVSATSRSIVTASLPTVPRMFTRPRAWPALTELVSVTPGGAALTRLSAGCSGETRPGPPRLSASDSTGGEITRETVASLTGRGVTTLPAVRGTRCVG